MASTVHLEVPLASGGTLTIDLAPADGGPTPGELLLVTRIVEVVHRSAAFTAGE
jgi:hypothetical protein